MWTHLLLCGMPHAKCPRTVAAPTAIALPNLSHWSNQAKVSSKSVNLHAGGCVDSWYIYVKGKKVPKLHVPQSNLVAPQL